MGTGNDTHCLHDNAFGAGPPAAGTVRGDTVPTVVHVGPRQRRPEVQRRHSYSPLLRARICAGHRYGDRTDRRSANTTHTPGIGPVEAGHKKLRTQFPRAVSAPDQKIGDLHRNVSSSQPSRTVRQVQDTREIGVHTSLFWLVDRFLIPSKLCVMFRLELRQELRSQKGNNVRTRG